MKLLSYPLRAIDSLIDRIAAVIGALLLSQFPAFIAHYLQRLGGHVDEATRNISEWQKIANRIAGGSLDRLLTMGQEAGSTFGIEAAKKCAMDVERLNDLTTSLNAIRNASAWNKGWMFIQHADADIVHSTANTFVPNIPLDLESLLHAGVGLLLAMLLYFILKQIVRCTYRAIRKKCTGQSKAPLDQDVE